NGSRAGLGPCEDLEGNVYRGIKLRLLKKLRALKTPTIVVESKAFNPAIEISQRSFLVRYNKEVDNSTVASSLCKALEELSFPFLCLDTAFPLLDKPAIEVEVERFLKHLLNLAKALSKSKTSRKRALLLGELAKLVSEDAGGIVFMSSQINRVARAVGLMPGTGAVISMCLPKAYIEEYRIPFVDERDVDETVLILRKATLRLWEGIEDAQRELNLKFRRFRKG
ncbi:MAG: hypothetical protein H5T71_05045, partial [Chloroflexi bacterium]|nr:hypothetical protein [Chloroflexota bacterium]